MAQSEVERLREQIAAEYQAAVLGLAGLASGCARHDFITARMERIGECYEQLQVFVGLDEALALVVETIMDGESALANVQMGQGEK